MNVSKHEVSYRYRTFEFRHHVIFLQDGREKILLSPFNLFLKDRASSRRLVGMQVTFADFSILYSQDTKKIAKGSGETHQKRIYVNGKKNRLKNGIGQKKQGQVIKPFLKMHL